MEKIAVLLIPGLFAWLLVRSLLVPMKAALRLGLHSGCGFACLWLLNAISAFTGILFPINAITVLVAGFLGIPGIGIMAMLEVMA